MELLLFLLALPIFLLFLIQKHRKNGKVLLSPPGPRGLPFIGNLHQLDNNSPQRHLWQLSKQYGPLMSLQLGVRPTLVVSSAKMAKEVMKIHDLEFAGRPYLVGQQKLSYQGLDLVFAPYNDYWREMRKICVLQVFNYKRVQSFSSIREDESKRLIEKISKLAPVNKLIDLSELAMTLTSDTVCRIAFGTRYEGEQASKFHGLLTEAQAMMGTFFAQDLFPWMGWVDRLTGIHGRLERNFKGLDEFYNRIIDEHLDPKRPKPENEDITDVLLRLKRENLFTIELTLDHIKGVLMNLFVAGTDTSAATIVWAMTMLMKTPRTMKKVQEEVRNLVGKKGFVNEEDLYKLPYLKAVVKETMRIHPAVPLLVPRETIQRCNIDGYDIEPKTLVYVNAWAIGRDPESWEKLEEFYPERFLGSSIDFKGTDFELIPFGAGRRGCPGIYMGAAAVELALANLLYAFDWEFPPGVKKEDIDTNTRPGITMHKKNHLCLKASKYDLVQ